MMKNNYGRLTPAMILLFLAQESHYGLSLYKKIQEKFPFNNIDTAIVYRSLSNLENANAVEAYWDTSESGQPRKWYRINGNGWNILRGYKENLERKRENIDFFLNCYEGLNKNEREQD